MPRLPLKVHAAGWYIYQEKRIGNLDRVILRNTQARKETILALLHELSQQLVADGWGIVHHGENDGVWSAVIERETKP